MAKRPTSKKGRVPKAMTLIGGIGGPMTAAISPGALISAAVQRQRPAPFVPKAKKGKKGRR
jgi:hypothetical protein